MRKLPREVDPIEEVRAVRDALAKQCGYDAAKLAALISADEVKSKFPLVSRPPKRFRGARRAS